MAWFITYSAAFESGMRDERILKQPLRVNKIVNINQLWIPADSYKSRKRLSAYGFRIVMLF